MARKRKYESRVRKQVEREIEAAIVLQAVQRGRVSRREAAVLRQERRQEEATVVLQVG